MPVTAGVEGMEALARAVSFTPPPPAREEFPGASLPEAWCLWETRIDGILKHVPEEERKDASERLGAAAGTSDRS